MPGQDGGVITYKVPLTAELGRLMKTHRKKQGMCTCGVAVQESAVSASPCCSEPTVVETVPACCDVWVLSQGTKWVKSSSYMMANVCGM